MGVRFVGIDCSSKKTGICLLINGKLDKYELLDFSNNNDTEDRMKEMAKALLNKLDEWKPTILFIEDSWSAVNVQVTKLLTRLMGVTFAWSVNNNCEWHEILPSRWRKYAGIEQGKKKRAELKQASIDYVKERYGIDVNDDVADSIALSDAVVNYYNSIN